MNALFPEGRITFRKVEADGAVLKEWPSYGLNLKAKVVCKTCNETWMSDVEGNYAKPAISDLILGKRVNEITTKRARNISLFAFKTAVVANHMLPKGEEFFTPAEGCAFRESFSIPPKVHMWLMGFPPGNAGGFQGANMYFPDRNHRQFTLNVCSFYVGQFGFQVVSFKGKPPGNWMHCPPTVPGLAIKFHPDIERGISWPRTVLLERDKFNAFAYRWKSVKSE